MSRASRFAAAVVMAGAVAAAGLPLGGGTPAAEGPSYNGGNCPGGMTCTHWCPGDPAIPGSQVLSWDWNVCHDSGHLGNSEGIVDVSTSTIYPWSGTPHQVAPPPLPMGPAPSLSPPPGMPFCSPRGSLIIIPPICDEIGYQLAAGIVEALGEYRSTREGARPRILQRKSVEGPVQ